MAKRKRRTSEQTQPVRKQRAPAAIPQTEQRITRAKGIQIRTESARQAVFQTFELLENIILRLPMNNILTAQRISKQFHGVIRKSKSIQERLFLVSVKSSNIWKVKESEWEWELVPAGPEEENNLLVQARVNPMFRREYSWGSTDASHAECNGGERLQMPFWLREVLDRRCKGKDLGPEPMDAMYLTSPPSTSATLSLGLVVETLPFVCTGYKLKLELQEADGITIGTLVRSLREQAPSVIFEEYTESENEVSFKGLSVLSRYRQGEAAVYLCRWGDIAFKGIICLIDNEPQYPLNMAMDPYPG